MILSRELRDNMLRNEWDVSRAEIASAIRDTIKIKNQRRQTVQNLNKDKVEELLEGASKKIFRSLMFKSSTTQELDLLNQQYMAVQELRQQEMKMVQQEQQQTFANDANKGSGNDIADSVVVVGLSIDDDEKIEGLDDDDDDDDDAEHKEDLPSAAATNNPSKKPIMIVETDDDAAILMNVESMKQQHTKNSAAPPILGRTESEQHQYKGENSSEDGSTNLNNSHHKAPTTTTTAAASMGNMAARTVTEI